MIRDFLISELENGQDCTTQDAVRTVKTANGGPDEHLVRLQTQTVAQGIVTSKVQFFAGFPRSGTCAPAADLRIFTTRTA